MSDQVAYRKEKDGNFESLLIGMALGGAQSRKRVTAKVDGSHLVGERNGGSLNAIRDNDRNAVIGWLGTYHGVYPREGEDIVDAVIRTALRRSCNRKMAELISEFTTGGGLTATVAIRSVLTDGLSLCDEMDAIDAANTMEPVA